MCLLFHSSVLKHHLSLLQCQTSHAHDVIPSRRKIELDLMIPWSSFDNGTHSGLQELPARKQIEIHSQVLNQNSV